MKTCLLSCPFLPLKTMLSPFFGMENSTATRCPPGEAGSQRWCPDMEQLTKSRGVFVCPWADNLLGMALWQATLPAGCSVRGAEHGTCPAPTEHPGFPFSTSSTPSVYPHANLPVH